MVTGELQVSCRPASETGAIQTTIRQTIIVRHAEEERERDRLTDRQQIGLQAAKSCLTHALRPVETRPSYSIFYDGVYDVPVTTGMGDRLRAGIPSRAATSQLGQLSLASLLGRLIEYQFLLG